MCYRKTLSRTIPSRLPLTFSKVPRKPAGEEKRLSLYTEDVDGCRRSVQPVYVVIHVTLGRSAALSRTNRLLVTRLIEIKVPNL